MKLLFLTLYSKLGGSSRYMVYDYLDFYREAGMEVMVSPLFDERYNLGLGNLASPTTFRHILCHTPYYSRRVAKRFYDILNVKQFNAVALEKELFPYFPFGLEKFLKLQQTKLVTLFDDAVHVYYAKHPYRLVRFFYRNKFEQIIRLSNQIIVWNRYLGDFARQFNSNVSVVNTGVDLRRYHLKNYQTKKEQNRVVIGWIGTPNSYPYLRTLEEVFRELAHRYQVELRIVSSIDYESPNIMVKNSHWTIETEVQDLCSFDIGIMPMPDSEWTRGKSGCKAVQYLAVGVPAVCSPVGITTEIIQDGVNGFLARNPEEWIEKLSLLIENSDLRLKQGLAGYEMVRQKYSIQAVAPDLIRIFKGLV